MIRLDDTQWPSKQGFGQIQYTLKRRRDLVPAKGFLGALKVAIHTKEPLLQPIIGKNKVEVMDNGSWKWIGCKSRFKIPHRRKSASSPYQSVRPLSFHEHLCVQLAIVVSEFCDSLGIQLFSPFLKLNDDFFCSAIERFS